jgi:hypothetical protein
MIQPAVIPQPTDSGPPSGQNLLLFRIYLIYRTVLSVVFLLLLMLPATRELVGAENPGAVHHRHRRVPVPRNLLLLGAVAAAGSAPTPGWCCCSAWISPASRCSATPAAGWSADFPCC